MSDLRKFAIEIQRYVRDIRPVATESPKRDAYNLLCKALDFLHDVLKEGEGRGLDIDWPYHGSDE